MDPPQPALERIGPYEVLGYLGEGGMGQVHKARAPDGPLVAVKVVRPGYAAVPEFRARFRREVASAMPVLRPRRPPCSACWRHTGRPPEQRRPTPSS